ncbi:glycosyltransferase [Candidatus Pelagibacter sp.]|nr:glycosyltransferase [Candidatus Pelagibacter sp.]
MKICYLSNSAIPSSVASSIQIIKMCEAFSELDNEVTLITTNVKKLKYETFSFYKVKKKFSIVRMKNFTKFPLGVNYYLFSFLSILESFKFKPDIYITRNFFTSFLLILFRKKTIIELHHDISIESRIVKILVKYFKFLNSKYINKAIAITEGVKTEYVKNKYILNNKVIVLPSGSSLKQKKQKLVKKNFLKIGYFGSLYKSRGLDLIIKLAKIDKKNQYFVYGNLDNLNFMKHKISTENLNFFKFAPYKEISSKMSEMDVLIIPYVSSITVAGDVGDITKYTSPLKLFDYLTTGKVIMCSDFKILKEVVNNKNVIFVKNFKNPFAWKMELQKLIPQFERKLIYSLNNQKLSKNFTLRERAKKILNLS